MQDTINERIKFLLKHYNMSARTFSRTIGVADNNTQNYISKNPALPKADYLERVLLHFQSINPAWLLTGKGEPFLAGTQDGVTQVGEFNQAGTGNKQKIKSNKGQANTGATPETQVNTSLESANKEIALLREQLAMKDQLIAAKEEMLSLLRSQFNRPN
jgi:DNA-binding transcriptional regulator YiaG